MLLTYIEIAYLIFQKPDELAVYLNKIPKILFHLVITLVAVSLSLAISIYYLKDSYDSYFAVHLLLLFLNHLFFLGIGSLLFSFILDNLVFLSSMERRGNVRDMIATSVFSLLPYMFFFPVAVFGKMLSKPMLFSVPFFLILTAWSFYILIRGVQFLYELPPARSALLIIVSSILLAVFSGSFLIFFSLEMIELLT